MVMVANPVRSATAKARLIDQGKVKVKASEAELVASICRESFYEFVKEWWDTVVQEKPIWNWHIRYICKRLQRYAERVFKGKARESDFVLNVPPGTTKSLLCSVFFPAWVWTRMPSAKFLGVSYSHTLAQDLSSKTRDVVKSDKYRACFPSVKIRDDQDAKAYFKNTDGGVRYAAGVDGTVTGFHFHFIVIDDPLNPNQSHSPVEVAKANRWIKSTLSSRKIDKRVSVTILVMQRLHEEDPTAQFVRKGKIVSHVRLPAQVEDTPLPSFLAKRYRKGLLDAIRLSAKVLKETEEDMGAMAYSAQYRQQPVPPGGGMFVVRRLKMGHPPDKFKRIARCWDKAGTTAGEDWGAFTVGVKLAMDFDGRVWVLDVIRVQMDSFEREKLIRRTAENDGKRCIVVLEQEGGSGGKESAENTVRSLVGFRVRTVTVGQGKGNKERRADPFSTQVNGGNVVLNLEGRDTWHGPFREELKYFPKGKYSDQVDAASGAFNVVIKNKRRVGAKK